MVEITTRTPCDFRYSISPARRSGRWLRPPPPGRSSAHSFLGRAHQILFGSTIFSSLRSAFDGESTRNLRIRPPRSRECEYTPAMCRVLGCVASEPVSLRHELLHAENPMIRQSEEHDSGWGMSIYRRAEGEAATCMRFPTAAYRDLDFRTATDSKARIFNVHVRRATMGGLTEENTHPFCLGNYSFSHNGTVLNFARLAVNGARPVHGQTDSEHLFNFLMCDFDPGDVINSLRACVARTIERSVFSGLNFLFSDGEKLYAYRLGLFELHWLARPGQLLVASERLTEEERWHSVQQDVLLVLDPQDVEEPHAERLVGDSVMEKARIQKFKDGSELRGAERGRFAAERAAQMGA